MGANIIITKPNGSRVPMESRATATAITAAKQTWALNAEDTIAITVVSPFPQSYGIGDVITVFGRDYRLNRLPKVSKTGMQEYQYDLEFEGIQYDLMRVTYDVNINTTNNKLQDIQGDSLTGDLKRFMEVLISNANRVFPGKWALGVCPETDGDNTLTFSESDNCLSVLQTLCSEDKFGVEFEIERVNNVYVINIKKTIGQTLPFVLEYGKGKGLYSISRENVSSSNIVTRLKVYGSTENITSKYRADRLCMYGKDKASSYIEKADAVAKYGIFEGRKNFDIKPTFPGKVSSVVDGDVLSFIDTSFPFDINAKNASGETLYLISGVSAKVHFNSGNLAGYEFEVHAYDHATHKFTLVKQTDDRGNVFPSETSPAFQIGKNDTYKVLDIAYSRDIEEDAEKKLAEEGNKYYDQNSQPKVQYSVNVTKAFIENKLALSDGITNVFAPGDYLPIKDDEIGVDKSIRIKSFTRNVLDPYDYSLTISDTQTKGDITTRVISDLVDIDKVLTINNLKDPAQARANWRSSREVLNMVFDPETGGYYKEKITPESVDTMMLSVGAKSMQFGLINTVFEPNFQGKPNLFKWKGGVLTHYTIDPDKARSWVLADGTTALQQDVPYYIYAVCNRDNSSGTMSISTTQHKVEESPNVYFFLIGILGSIDADTKVRAISLTYGFTMINGRFIKTGRIESADGTTYFDLDNSEIGGRIVFNSNGEEKTLEQLGKDAIDAAIAASNAQDTADGKRRVFVATPTTPYDIGDLWVNGSILRRCATAKTATQSYNVDDWVVAVDYDNTKTVIDGGLVTSGTIQVAGDNASILAGITGKGRTDDAIRFWAGASFENRATAPFRVQQNGKAIATNLHISEKSTFAGELKGASGSFYGIVKISLLYNAVKNLSQATYYVDPENEPFNWFVYNNPTIDTRLYLPDANKYDGMEISVFIVYTGSQWSAATYNYVSPTNGNKLLCMQNMHIHNLSTTDYAVMRKYNAPYQGDTRGWRIMFNTLYRFKAIGGHWYAIDGVFNGE